MRIFAIALGGMLLFGVTALGQNSNDAPGANSAPPRSSQNQPSDDSNASSSRDTQIDIAPPKNDAKDHPNSGLRDMDPAPAPPTKDASDVNEVHPYNPYRATKDDEVGEYYFKIKDYAGALARFQDALVYKENDAIANFRLGQCYEKLNNPAEAVKSYRAYLKILPNGEYAKDARKRLEKLPAATDTAQK